MLMEQNGNTAQAECNGNCSGLERRPSFRHGLIERLFLPWVFLLFGTGRYNSICCANQKCRKQESREQWLKSFGLVKSDDMPPDLREMYLLVGYRPVPSSFWYCIKSIFYPTNETLNFWTHFVALFFLIHRFYSIIQDLQGPLSHPLYYPLWVYAFGCCIMLIGSCVAHMFCSNSRNIRDSCWFCDYASITLSFLGSSIVYHNYICPYECMELPIKNYVQILGIGGVVGHAACCYSRRISSNIKYALRSSVFVFLYVGTSIPCGYMYVFKAFTTNSSPITDDVRCSLGTSYFMLAFPLVTLFCVLTVFFNVSKIPERWYPGTFDLIGHSHQWLHVSIALAFFWQTYLLEGPLLRAESMLAEGSLSLEQLGITWWNTVGTMAAVGLCCLGTSYLMSGKSSSFVKEQKTR